MNAMKKHMVMKTRATGLSYLAQVKVDSNGRYYHVHRMDHLACFVPGMLAIDGTHSYTFEYNNASISPVSPSCRSFLF